MAEEVIEVFWTDSAKSTFDQIIKYLQRSGQIKRLRIRSTDDGAHRHVEAIPGDVPALVKKEECPDWNFE